MRRSVLVGILLITSGCAMHMTPRDAPISVPKVCWDGQPPRIFLHERCPTGICGYTCEPNRWPVGVLAR